MALEGKVAAVTGAALGLGRGFSEMLLEHGAKVALLDVNEVAGKSLKEALDKKYGSDRSLFVICDVQSQVQFKAAFEKIIEVFGRPDIFCNNAGIVDESDWEKAISINLMGVVRGAYLALEHMSKLTGGQGGVIINIASMAGLGPLLCAPVYTATKHGVIGFTRAMAEASKALGYGVRFNALCPFFTNTDILGAFDSPGKTGQFHNLADATKKMLDAFRVLEVSEVTKSFLQLVMDESKTGEALVVHPKGSKYYTFVPVRL